MIPDHFDVSASKNANSSFSSVPFRIKHKPQSIILLFYERTFRFPHVDGVIIYNKC